MDWKFDVSRTEGEGYTIFEGTAQHRTGEETLAIFVIAGENYTSLEASPLRSSSYQLADEFSSIIGTPSSGPHLRPTLLAGEKGGFGLFASWTFPEERREEVVGAIAQLLVAHPEN